jgi:hypothetical protein
VDINQLDSERIVKNKTKSVQKSPRIFMPPSNSPSTTFNCLWKTNPFQAHFSLGILGSLGVSNAQKKSSGKEETAALFQVEYLALEGGGG